jgi:hypothetical protein
MRVWIWIAIAISSSIALAEEGPVVLPIAKLGAGELSAVLPSEKVLIILAIALQVIYKLLTYIFEDKEKKKSEESTETKGNFERLFKIVHEMQGVLNTLRRAPTEEELVQRIQPHIELGVLRAMKKYESRKP